MNRFPSLDALFSPRTIALVGASNTDGKLGQQVAFRLAQGFDGRFYPISLREEVVAHVASLRALNELPEPVDLVIALTPGRSLIEAIEACPPGVARFLLAIPSGFGEVPGEGVGLQDRLLAAARRARIRVVGPNCVGLINGSIGLNASIIPFMPPGGPGLSVVTQSGGFGMAMAMYAVDNGLPVSKFCDVGNMVDLEVADFLDWLATDPDSRVIGLFLESVRDFDAFGAALERLVATKPVVATIVGRTAGGVVRPSRNTPELRRTRASAAIRRRHRVDRS
jgi:acyl-CoA synthetase (NDP forming)